MRRARRSTVATKRVSENKNVMVTAYPNIAPAGITISKVGKGSSLAVAICRGVDAVLKDKRIKGKRLVFPIKFVVTE